MSENTNDRKDKGVTVIMKDLTPDEYQKYLYEMREKALHDEATALNSAEKRGVEKGMKDGIKKGMKDGIKKGRAEGIAEGIKKGKAEGRAEGRVSRESEIAKNLRKMGMTEEQIKKALEM